MGAFYANYLSATERALTTIPVYLALGYKIPLDLPISFILRAGGGEAFVVARPSNTSRWDPMMIVGLETSFVAGKKFESEFELITIKFMSLVWTPQEKQNILIQVLMKIPD